jgi:hypothetical protein
MNRSLRLAALLLAGLTLPAGAQEKTPTMPLWADSLRPGGGPSFGSPFPEFDRTKPVTQWCLGTSEWWQASGPRLRQILSDTSVSGLAWRKLLGNATALSASDSLPMVTDEVRCLNAARVIHQGLLGWPEGPPPIVMVDLPDGSAIAFPAATHFGEFGAIVRFNAGRQIVAVAMW